MIPFAAFLNLLLPSPDLPAELSIPSQNDNFERQRIRATLPGYRTIGCARERSLYYVGEVLASAATRAQC